MAALDLGGVVSLEPGGEELSLSVESPWELGPPEENLVWRAVSSACTSWGELPGARLQLVKEVPHQAGLGGGSADAAAALRAARDWLRPGMPDRELAGLAAGLGADVTFFLSGGYGLGRGRGEQVEPVASDLRLPVIVWKPAEGLATGPAYAALDRARGWERGAADREPEGAEAEAAGLVQALGRGDAAALLSGVANDFHQALVPAHAFLQDAVRELEAVGARALLSGSGSAVVGLFVETSARDAALARLDPPGGAWLRPAELGGPGVARLG